MALRFLDHRIIVRRLEGKLILGILCTNVPWPAHVIQHSFSLDTWTLIRVAFEVWPKFGSRGTSVLLSTLYVGSQEVVFGVQHRSRWTLPRIQQPAMDDTSLSVDEGGEGMCETDDTMYCWAGQLAMGCLQGSPLTFIRIPTRASCETSSVWFSSSAVVTEYPVTGSYGLGSAIVESKGVDGCGERRRFRIIRRTA